MNRLRALLQAAWDEYVSAHSSPLIITGAGYLWVAPPPRQPHPPLHPAEGSSQAGRTHPPVVHSPTAPRQPDEAGNPAAGTRISRHDRRPIF